MGYLFSWLSLSKYATEKALDASELIIIVSGFVLAFGAVGEYLEEHNRLPKWMKWPKLVFILMVVVSLIGEFVGDAGVFVFSKELQKLEGAEIEALDLKATAARDKADEAGRRAEQVRHVADGLAQTLLGVQQEAKDLSRDTAAAKARLVELLPRHILVRQGEKELLADIEPFKGQKVELQLCHGLEGDFETNFLTQALVDVLNKAKWDVHSAVRLACISGIGVSVYTNWESSSSTLDAANALGRILQKALLEQNGTSSR